MSKSNVRLKLNLALCKNSGQWLLLFVLLLLVFALTQPQLLVLVMV